MEYSLIFQIISGVNFPITIQYSQYEENIGIYLKLWIEIDLNNFKLIDLEQFDIPPLKFKT